MVIHSLENSNDNPIFVGADDSEYGSLADSPQNLQQDENTTGGHRSSWLKSRRSPFRSSGRSISNGTIDFCLSPESTISAASKSPVPNKTSANSCSSNMALSPPKRMLLREKLMNSITKKRAMMRHNSNTDNNSTSTVLFRQQGEEGIDDVYDNVEALLEVFRLERHQEKLRADEEIKVLKDRLAVYETTNTSMDGSSHGTTVRNRSSRNSSCSYSNSSSRDELAECLQETMALLEEECLEWQTQMACTKSSSRLSLDNITNHHHHLNNNNGIMATPSPQKQHDRSTKPATSNTNTPRQNELVKSLHRLRAVSSRLQHQESNTSVLAVLDFDKEVGNNNMTNAKEGQENDPLLGLGLLESELDVTTHNGATAIATTSDSIPTTDNKQTEEQINELQEEIGQLRQHLWDQMVQCGQQKKELNDQLTSQISQKVNLHVQLQSLVEEKDMQFKDLQRELETRVSLKNQLELLRASSGLSADSVDRYKARINDLQHDLEELYQVSKTQLDSKDQELQDAKHDLTLMKTTQEVNDLLGSKYQSLLQQQRGMERQTSESDQQRLKIQMELGIEQHSKLGMKVKLERAQASLKEQSDETVQLRQQVVGSKRRVRLYSNQVDYLTDELQRVRLEARESLEDKSLAVRQYRMDVALLKDDLNNSFCMM